jgi:hypothetical protein
MQSFGVYGFDPEVSAAPVNQETVKADPAPEPLMKSVDPQLSTGVNTDDEAEYEYKFDEDKKAFIKYKKTEDQEDHYSKYLQFMKDTYDIDLNEETKENVDMKEMMNAPQPVLEAANDGSYADMIKKK